MSVKLQDGNTVRLLGDATYTIYRVDGDNYRDTNIGATINRYTTVIGPDGNHDNFLTDSLCVVAQPMSERDCLEVLRILAEKRMPLQLQINMREDFASRCLIEG